MSNKFGFSGLALSEDGSKLVVGDAERVPTVGTYNAAGEGIQLGEVQVYDTALSPSTPTLVQTILPPVSAGEQQFGSDVAITPDGTTIAVGSRQFGEPFDDLNDLFIIETNSSGEVISCRVDRGGNPGASSRGYPTSGTFSTSSETYASTTPATFSFTSVQGVISSNGITVTSPGSGFPPDSALPLSPLDWPTRSQEQRFWPNIEGSATNVLVNRTGLGQIRLYRKNGETYSTVASGETLNWLSAAEAPKIGTTVDVNALGTIAVASAPQEGYHSLYRQTFQPGMAVVFEEVDTPEPTGQNMSYVGVISPTTLPDYTPGGMVPPVLGPNILYGILHKMSADGTTIIVARKDVPVVDVWITEDGGETWTLDSSLDIYYSSVGDAHQITALSISDDGTKFVALFSHVDILNIHPLEKQPPYFINTWYKAGSPAIWTSGTINYNGRHLANGTTVAMSGDGRYLIAAQEDRIPFIPFNAQTAVNGTSNRVTSFNNTYMGKLVQYSNVEPVTGASGKYIRGATGTEYIGLVDGAYYWTHRMASLQATFHENLDDLWYSDPPIFYSDGVAAENTVDLTPATTPETHTFTATEPSSGGTFLTRWDWNAGTGSWNFGSSPQFTKRYNQQTSLYVVNPTDYGYLYRTLSHQHGCGISLPYDGSLIAISSTTRVEPEDGSILVNGPREREVSLFRLEAAVEGPPQWTAFLQLFNGPYSFSFDSNVPFESKTTVQFSGDGTRLLFLDQMLNHVYVCEADAFTTDAYVWKKLITSDTPTEYTGFAGTNTSYPLGGAISKDGNTIVVGAWAENSIEGGLYVFRRVNEEWIRNEYIPAPCPSYDGAFGITVSVNETGTLASVAAPNVIDGPGQINIFSLTPPAAAPGCPVVTEETQTHAYILKKIVNPSNVVDRIQVGNSVSITPDATRAVVGGAEVAVLYNAGSGSWNIEQQLIPTELPTLSDRINADYGISVAINSAGTRVAVSALTAEVDATLSVGQVYIFDRSGSAWTQTATLDPPAGFVEDWRMGYNIAMNPTGNVLAVTRGEGYLPSEPDQVYIFRNTTGTTWVQSTISTGVDAFEPFTASLDYVDNGTDKGIVAFVTYTYEGGDDVCTLYVYEHVYGTPDTLTQSYTYQWFSFNTGLSPYGLSLSPNQGEYLAVSDTDLDAVYVFKNEGMIGADRDPSGPWSIVSTIQPSVNLASIPGTMIENTLFPEVRFGESIFFNSNLDLMISSYDFTWPDNRSELFFGGSAWIYQKQTGLDEWVVDGTRRIFPVGANGQSFGGGVAVSDALNTIVLGGAQKRLYSPNSIFITYGAGELQVYEREEITVIANETWSISDTIEDTDPLHAGFAYGDGSCTISGDGSTLAACYAASDTTDDFVDIYSISSGVASLQQRIEVGSNLSAGFHRMKLSSTGDKLVVLEEGTSTILTFLRSGVVWSETASPLTITQTLYTQDFEMSADGTTLFLTGTYTSGLGDTQVILVYSWNGTTEAWDLENDTVADGSNANIADEYTDTNAMPVPLYGFSVSASTNGNWFVTTGYRYCYASIVEGWSPCAYVYHRSGTPATWNLHSITPLFQATQDTSFPVEGDTPLCAMNAAGNSFVVASPGMARLWVADLDGSTSVWNTQTLIAKTTSGGNILDNLGSPWALDIDAAGNYIVAGSFDGDRVIIWRKLPQGWRQEQIISAPLGISDTERFGSCVNISSDGTLVVINDSRNNLTDTNGGMVYLFYNPSV